MAGCKPLPPPSAWAPSSKPATCAQRQRASRVLGAKFIDVSYDTPEEKKPPKAAAVYAKAMPASWLERQKTEVGPNAWPPPTSSPPPPDPRASRPVLVTEDMVRAMKPGSVIVDLAAGRGRGGQGGNCPLSEADKTVIKHGVTIVGETNLAAACRDASALYARTLLTS